MCSGWLQCFLVSRQSVWRLAVTSERLWRHKHNSLSSVSASHRLCLLQRTRSLKTSPRPSGSTSEIEMVAWSAYPAVMPELLSGGKKSLHPPPQSEPTPFLHMNTQSGMHTLKTCICPSVFHQCFHCPNCKHKFKTNFISGPQTAGSGHLSIRPTQSK